MVTTPPRCSIGDHGLIGDTRTAALVTSDGTIDWMCVPHFDGSPLFGQLVGGPAAGSFRAGPAEPARQQCGATCRALRPSKRSGISTTTLTLTDGMVADSQIGSCPTFVVRRLTRQEPVRRAVFFDPRFGDGHVEPRAELARRAGVLVGSARDRADSDPSITIDPEYR
jgi:hypothetical protein